MLPCRQSIFVIHTIVSQQPNPLAYSARHGQSGVLSRHRAQVHREVLPVSSVLFVDSHVNVNSAKLYGNHRAQLQIKTFDVT